MEIWNGRLASRSHRILSLHQFTHQQTGGRESIRIFSEFPLSPFDPIAVLPTYVSTILARKKLAAFPAVIRAGKLSRNQVVMEAGNCADKWYRERP